MVKIKNKKTKKQVEILNLYESPSYEKYEEKQDNEVENTDAEVENNEDINVESILDLDERTKQEVYEPKKLENTNEERITFKEIKKDNLLKRNISIATFFKVVVIFFFTLLILVMCIRFFSSNSYSNTPKTTNNDNSIKYKLVDYNSNEYDYKLLKTTSVLDNITLTDKDNNKEIQYAFKIYNGKVVVYNGKNEYTIKSIKKAERLLVATMRNIIEHSSVFVITSDGNVYSVSLFDNKYNLIKDYKNFEKTITSYKFNSRITDMSFGVYKSKEEIDENNIVLLTDDNGKQYVLTK